MGRANLIAELLKGRPVKKFVYIDQGSDGPEIAGVKAGDICEFIHDIHGTEFRLKLPNGDTFLCSPRRLRELDDSPIAAGDEVVCVDASHGAAGNQYLTVGKAYQVYRHNNFLTVMNDIGNHCQPVFDRFVKVKPLPQPEVKQEAAEKSEHDSFFVKTKLHDGSTVEQWFPTHAAACDHAKEMCRNGTAKNARVCKTVTLIEAQEPKMTSF